MREASIQGRKRGDKGITARTVRRVTEVSSPFKVDGPPLAQMAVSHENYTSRGRYASSRDRRNIPVFRWST